MPGLVERFKSFEYIRHSQAEGRRESLRGDPLRRLAAGEDENTQNYCFLKLRNIPDIANQKSEC